MNTFRARLGAMSLVIAGLFFVLYPAIRPFSNEASLQGAAAFASVSWIVAHMLAVVGFILLVLGLLGLHIILQKTPGERLAFLALILTGIGVGFVLPYYGAEIFALHTIGQEALKQHSTALLAMVDAIRYGPGALVFLIGLLLLAVGPILAAIAIWRSGILLRWSGLPFALGFVLYLPQFFGSQPIRVAHGLLITIGCAWLALEMWKQSQKVSHTVAIN